MGHPDFASGLAYPKQLARCFLLVRGEHRPERRKHAAKGGVGEGDLFGIALLEVDQQTFGGGPLASVLEHGRDVVDAGYFAKAAGGSEGRVTVPGLHVEHPPTGAQIHCFAEHLGYDEDDAYL